ncbi:MAG: DUF1489 domain-containing protein [Pseudomonadota bacterium]
MIKLCVGAETIRDLEVWQQRVMRDNPKPVHHTRMTPKRRDEILSGGSIYWVIKKMIRVRQRIVDIRTFDDGAGRSMCELVFDPELVALVPRRKKPFQGWRYLKPGDAPADLDPGAKASDVPHDLDEALKAAMVW